MAEEWKTIAEGYYEVSNHGRVRRLKPGNGTWPGRLIATKTGMNGYRLLALNYNGKRKTTSTHRLVAEAFIGPIGEGGIVHHIDGDKSNNHVDNLERTTYKAHGQRAMHAGCGVRDVKRSTVMVIKLLGLAGWTPDELSTLTDIDRSECEAIASFT